MKNRLCSILSPAKNVKELFYIHIYAAVSTDDEMKCLTDYNPFQRGVLTYLFAEEWESLERSRKAGNQQNK